MKKVRFSGVGRVGTLRPRRVWSPGEVLEVEDDVAKQLTGQPGFEIVRSRSRRRASQKEAESKAPVEESELEPVEEKAPSEAEEEDEKR